MTLIFDERFNPRREFFKNVPVSHYKVHYTFVHIQTSACFLVGSCVVIWPREVFVKRTEFILGMHQFCQHLSEATFLKAIPELKMSLIYTRKMEAKGLPLMFCLLKI